MNRALVACGMGMLLAAAAGCGPASGMGVVATGRQTAQTTPAKQYADPFAYCAAVGTVDSPGTDYVGSKVPDEIIAGYKRAAGLEAGTEPIEMMRETTIWRCMGGQVYACNFGANLPCDSKADTSDAATPAMERYCRANADSDSIPMSVTGHATIYSWHCVANYAATLDQIDQADAAGYLERIWYKIPPNP